MGVTRRDFVKMAGMAALGATFGNAFMAGKTAMAGEAGKQAARRGKYDTNRPQVPGYFRLKLGDMEITPLCDGMGMFNPAMCTETTLTAEEIDEMVSRDFVPRTESGIAKVSINAFLVNTGEQVILFDAGKGYVDGEIFLEKHGRVTEFLDAAGYAPEDIDIILPTHLHADHICGIEENGQSVFPNAALYIAEPEKAFWLDSDMDSLPEAAQIPAQLARTAVKPYLAAKRVKTFKPGKEILPNVKSVPLFGHTPGHTGYLVSSKGQSLFIWGDLLHVKFIQLVHPDVGIVFDSDSKAAIRTREELLPRLAVKKQLVCGAHLPFPGVGYLEKHGEDYHFHPIEYQIYY